MIMASNIFMIGEATSEDIIFNKKYLMAEWTSKGDSYMFLWKYYYLPWPKTEYVTLTV